MNYETVGEFLSYLKEKSGRGDNEIIKVADLKKVEQKNRTIKEFISEFRRAAKESRYKRRLLVEEFK